jgi:predicted transcriptional regulator
MVQYKYKQKYKQTSSHRARVVHILAAVSRYPGDGIPRYRLQCEASLSTIQLHEYLYFMVDNGLLLVTQDNRKLHKGKPRKLYHISRSKGHLFMKLYDEMHKADLLYGVSK